MATITLFCEKRARSSRFSKPAGVLLKHTTILYAHFISSRGAQVYDGREISRVCFEKSAFFRGYMRCTIIVLALEDEEGKKLGKRVKEESSCVCVLLAQ